MDLDDETLIAGYVIDYYNWLTDNGGRNSDELLGLSLTPAQRRLLLERMDDVNTVFSVTAPLHRAAGHRPPAIRG